VEAKAGRQSKEKAEVVLRQGKEQGEEATAWVV